MYMYIHTVYIHIYMCVYIPVANSKLIAATLLVEQHGLCLHLVNESCGWVMSHLSVSHVTRVSESCGWVMSHLSVSHVTRVSESCGWVMSHVSVSHVTRVSESCGWVMSHVWVSHVARVSESCHTYQWVMWVSHVTFVSESSRTYEWVTSHIRMNCASTSNDCACISTMHHITLETASYHCTMRHCHSKCVTST